MRRFFQQKKCVTRIIDFTHKKVFDAQTYTALTFLNKQENEAITFDRIKDDCTPQKFLSTVNGSLNYLKDLDVKKWRLLKADEQKNIKTIFGNLINPISKVENIDVVQKIFNSIVMHYYISKTSVSIEGGYPCYQKNFIEKFTVPEFCENEIETLRSLNCQQQIDNFLIKKYHLNLSAPNLAE